jgi:hypothetical protein
VRKISPLGLFAGIYLAAAPAAADIPIEVDCAAWSAESRAQVEARIRITLAAEALQARRLRVICGADGSVRVDVESEHGARLEPVARRSPHIEDDVVAAVEAALRALLPEPSEPEPEAAPPAPAATPEPVAPLPVPTSTVTAAPEPVVAPAPAESARGAEARAELRLTPAAEWWGGHAALGGDVGLAVGSEYFQYGLALGVRAALGEPQSFQVSEGGAAARFARTFPTAFGLRATLGVGASLLVTTPAGGVVSESATLLGAAYLELQLGRPFWRGAFGLEPALGVRVFGGSREVRVDEEQRLSLPVLVPQAGLSLLYRPH